MDVGKSTKVIYHGEDAGRTGQKSQKACKWQTTLRKVPAVSLWVQAKSWAFMDNVVVGWIYAEASLRSPSLGVLAVLDPDRLLSSIRRLVAAWITAI